LLSRRTGPTSRAAGRPPRPALDWQAHPGEGALHEASGFVEPGATRRGEEVHARDVGARGEPSQEVVSDHACQTASAIAREGRHVRHDPHRPVGCSRAGDELAQLTDDGCRDLSVDLRDDDAHRRCPDASAEPRQCGVTPRIVLELLSVGAHRLEHQRAKLNERGGILSGCLTDDHPGCRVAAGFVAHLGGPSSRRRRISARPSGESGRSHHDSTHQVAPASTHCATGGRTVPKEPWLSPSTTTS
jgi:hypothetical protein